MYKTSQQREPEQPRRVEYLSRGTEPPQTVHVFLSGRNGEITVVADQVEIEQHFIVFHLSAKASPPMEREVARFSNDSFQGWVKVAA
jgi:hypothetical protein